MKDSKRRARIMASAFVQGGHTSWVDFLASKTIAEEVATRVRRHLHAAGVHQSYSPHLVTVKDCSQLRGTFTVAVYLPGVRHNDPDLKELNDKESQTGLDALKASVRFSDLDPRLMQLRPRR